MNDETKQTTKRYTPRSTSYKEETLKLADRIGCTDAARQLGFHESQLYGWRAKQTQQQTVNSREQEQAAEIAKLKRELLIAQVKYAFIQQHRQELCIPHLCQALGVARSSYYEWLERQPNYQQREQRQALLDTQVATAFLDQKRLL